MAQYMHTKYTGGHLDSMAAMQNDVRSFASMLAPKWNRDLHFWSSLMVLGWIIVDGTIFVIAVLSGQSKEDPVQIKD